MRAERFGAAAVAAGMTLTLLVSGPAGGVVGGGTSVVDPATVPTYERYQLDYAVPTATQWNEKGTFPLSGDFNGDGRTDMFMYSAGSTPDALWLAKEGTGVFADRADRFTQVPRSVSGSYFPFVGDFDGNGSDDIFWYAPGRYPDSIWYHDENGSIIETAPMVVNGAYQPIVADFDQDDGVPSDDILWYSSRYPESLWSGQSSRRFTGRSLPSAPNNSIPLLGNWMPDDALTDGYGTTFFPDVFFYTPGRGADAIWSSDGTGDFTSEAKVVNGSYRPIVGNFNQGAPAVAGALTDVFWYAPGTRGDYVWINTTTSQDTFEHTNTAARVNATGYQPFVLPGMTGADSIVWNNPYGADYVWSPKGDPGVWDYDDIRWPGPDMGGRRPFVGHFDDSFEGLESVATPLASLLLSRLAGEPDPTFPWPGGSEVVTTSVDLPRVDMFFYGPDTTTDWMWRTDDTTIDVWSLSTET